MLRDLLQEAFPVKDDAGGLASEDGPKPLTDKVKVFEAVQDWLAERAKLVPEDRGKGKGEQLRDRFKSRTASSRRNSKGGAQSADADDSEPPGGSAFNGTNTADA